MSKKILLVEDDQAIIDVYQSAFKAAGIDAEVIDWGKQAIEKIKEIQAGKAEKPALVLLDLLLLDINGSEVLKEMKNNSETKDIPVFILSNYSDKESQQKSGVHADRFILKTDVTPTKLVKIIKEAIGDK